MTRRWNRALVTGASSGIGDAIARRLAGAGTDLVVVARDRDRLERLAADLPVATEVLPADLADPAAVDRVAARIEADDAPVDLVVNNAGFGNYGPFAGLDRDAETAVVTVNVAALHRLCHAAAGALGSRGGGGILNVASVAGLMPSASGATYNATKAFVVSLSESLHLELRSAGVHVTALCPGLTRTEFQDRAGIDLSDLPGFLWQDADTVAAAGLAGVAAGRVRVVTGIHNKVAVTGLRLVPGPIGRRLITTLSPDR